MTDIRTVTKAYEFRAIHRLDRTSTSHPDHELHAHDYRLTLAWLVADGDTNGWLVGPPPAVVGFDHWLDAYVANKELGTTIDFPTVAANLVDYFLDVTDTYDLGVHWIMLVVDGVQSWQRIRS